MPHTPGPWRVHAMTDATDCTMVDVVAENGALICMVAGRTDVTNADANARLIAAAPALYEAIIELLRSRVRIGFEDAVAMERIRRALALVDDPEAVTP
jgi:hypothetical protein